MPTCRGEDQLPAAPLRTATLVPRLPTRDPPQTQAQRTLPLSPRSHNGLPLSGRTRFRTSSASCCSCRGASRWERRSRSSLHPSTPSRSPPRRATSRRPRRAACSASASGRTPRATTRASSPPRSSRCSSSAQAWARSRALWRWQGSSGCGARMRVRRE